VPEPQTIIIGGGLAGLAAAVSMTEHRQPVTLLESRPRLGGRASAFVDQTTGETIDNCQHVGMGCCTNLQQFCRTVGVADKFHIERALTFIDPEGKRSTLCASPLPAPLHLFPSLLKAAYLSLGEKRQLAFAVRRLARWRPGQTATSVSFGDWLNEQQQQHRIIERFWEPILVSALSESLDRIDMGHARKVIVDGFLSNRNGW